MRREPPSRLAAWATERSTSAGATSACTRARDSGSSVTVVVTEDIAAHDTRADAAGTGAAAGRLAPHRPGRAPLRGRHRRGRVRHTASMAADPRPDVRRLTNTGQGAAPG